jgi:TPR repeat protein
MSSNHPRSPRFNIAIVLSIACLTSSACAHITPAEDTSQNNRVEDEAIAKEVRKSAEVGNASAQYRLGLFYTGGVGVPQNYGDAKEWFEKAAKQGHVRAQADLGTLYLQGTGAPQSDQMAMFWFGQAAEHGDGLACAKLGWMYAKGQGVIQDYVQAHMWYSLGAGQGEQSAVEAGDALAKQMTAVQMADAQKLARKWKPKKHLVTSRAPGSDTLPAAR